MPQRIKLIRWICIAAAGASLLHALFGALDSTREALVMMASLAAGGTLLGRVRPAPRMAITAGVFAAIDAAYSFPATSSEAVAVLSVYGLAALALLVGGIYLQRFGREAFAARVGP